MGLSASGEQAVRLAIHTGAPATGTVIAADSGLASLSLAGYYARGTGRPLVYGMSITDYAGDYMKLLGTRAASPTLFGLTATSAKHAAFLSLADNVPTYNPPEFRAEGTSVSGATRTITVSSVANAASYRALDTDGGQVATSSSTALAVPSDELSLLIEAVSSSGAVLRSFQYKSTPVDELTPTDTSAQMLGSRNGTAYLVFSGGAGNPRMVQRGVVDPYDPTVHGTRTGATRPGSTLRCTSIPHELPGRRTLVTLTSGTVRTHGFRRVARMPA